MALRSFSIDPSAGYKTLASQLEAACDDDEVVLMLDAAAVVATGLAAFRGAPYSRPMATADDILQEGCGDCGLKDILYTAIMAAVGIKARRVTFSGVPVQVGHACTEVFAEGRWRFVDPSLGVYFSAIDTDEPLSLDEARFLFPKVRMWRPSRALFSGLTTAVETDWRQCKEDTVLDPVDGRPLTSATITYFLSRAKGAELRGLGEVLQYIDLRGHKMFQHGTVGDKGKALTRPIQSEHGVVLPEALERIGSYHAENIRHHFTVAVDAPARVNCEVVFASPEALPQDVYGHVEPFVSPEHTTGKNDGRYRYVEHEIDGARNVLKLTFWALPPAVNLYVSTAWGVPKYVESYTFMRRRAPLTEDGFTLPQRSFPFNSAMPADEASPDVV